MYIGDEILGPGVCLLFYLFMIPVWSILLLKLIKNSQKRFFPLLFGGTAFCLSFVLISSISQEIEKGHALGATLLSIVLGPVAAFFILSFAILIQALVFNYGTVDSFAANSFVFAFIASFMGYHIFNFLGGNKVKISQKISPKNDNVEEETEKEERFLLLRKAVLAGISAYFSISILSLIVSVLFNIENILGNGLSEIFTSFSLSHKQDINNLLFRNLFVFGIVEAFFTILVMWFLYEEKSFFAFLKNKGYKPETIKIFNFEKQRD